MKKITNYKIQITKKTAHELHELTRIGATSNEKFLQMFHGVQMLHGGAFYKKRPSWRRRQVSE